MFQKGDHMVVLAALYHFCSCWWNICKLSSQNQNDIGGGMGKDYMKEHWGIDDDK